MECDRDTKNGNYSLSLKGTYTLLGLGKDKYVAMQNVSRVNNVAEKSSRNQAD